MAIMVTDGRGIGRGEQKNIAAPPPPVDSSNSGDHKAHGVETLIRNRGESAAAAATAAAAVVFDGSLLKPGPIETTGSRVTRTMKFQSRKYSVSRSERKGGREGEEKGCAYRPLSELSGDERKSLREIADNT